MQKSFLRTAVLLASTSVSAVAFAADLPMYEPPAEVAPVPVNWTGFYLGVAGGGGIMNYDTDVLGGVLNLNGFGGQGGLIEGTAGFDYQMGNFVLGALGDVHWSNMKTDLSIPVIPGGASASLESQWGFDLLARGGVLLTPRALLYVLGGYSWERFEGKLSVPALPLSLSSNEDTSGWTIGGGLEVLVTDRLSIKGEYRYTGFDDFDFGTGGILKMEPHRQTARIGANYKLGVPFGGAGAGYAAPMAYADGSPSWTGIYVGAEAGGAFQNLDTDLNIAGTRVATLDGFGGQGLLAGGTLGFDYQMGRFVVGALGDVDWNNTESTASVLGIANARLQEQWGADVLGRVGFLANDRSLIYALGGWSWEKYEGSLSIPLLGVSLSDDETTNGFTVGAGLEVMVTNNLSVKGEYRYTDFDSIDFGTGGVIDIEPERQSARVGVNYKFGGMFGH